MYGESYIAEHFWKNIDYIFRILNMRKISCLIYNAIFVVRDMRLCRRMDMYIGKMSSPFHISIKWKAASVGLVLHRS